MSHAHPELGTPPPLPKNGLRIVPLTDAWACRHILVCFRDEATLALPAKMLLDHLSPPRPAQLISPTNA